MLASLLLHGLWDPWILYSWFGSHKPCKSTDATMVRPKRSFLTHDRSSPFCSPDYPPRSQQLPSSTFRPQFLKHLALLLPMLFLVCLCSFQNISIEKKKQLFTLQRGLLKHHWWQKPLQRAYFSKGSFKFVTERCCLHFARYCIFCPSEVLIQKILHIFLKCNVQLSNFHNLLAFSIQFL